jgi:hypothetical protein
MKYSFVFIFLIFSQFLLSQKLPIWDNYLDQKIEWKNAWARNLKNQTYIGTSDENGIIKVWSLNNKFEKIDSEKFIIKITAGNAESPISIYTFTYILNCKEESMLLTYVEKLESDGRYIDGQPKEVFKYIRLNDNLVDRVAFLLCK